MLIKYGCGKAMKGKCDHIIVWHNGMSLADKFNPAASFLFLWPGITVETNHPTVSASIVF